MPPRLEVLGRTDASPAFALVERLEGAHAVPEMARAQRGSPFSAAFGRAWAAHAALRLEQGALDAALADARAAVDLAPDDPWPCQAPIDLELAGELPPALRGRALARLEWGDLSAARADLGRFRAYRHEEAVKQLIEMLDPALESE